MAKTTLGPRNLLFPMPVVLIGANVDGKPNFMAVAWCGICCSDPPTLTIGIRHPRYTLKGIKQNLTFSVNVPSSNLVKEADYCGITTGAKIDKVKDCRFDVFYGKLESAPLIEQFPVNMECKVLHMLDVGSHTLIVGRIEESHVSEDCLTNGEPDVDKIKPVIYGSSQGQYYVYGKAIGKSHRIGLELKPKQTKNMQS